jgi:DNA (cytosine-5)-methyltransferase 1
MSSAQPKPAWRVSNGAKRRQQRNRGTGGFHFPLKRLTSALRESEIVVDLFAGGGGASTALEQALGRAPDIALNHDEWAIGMHAANHPYTQHMHSDVWLANPVFLTAGRPVGWFHASPDCTHFSQAKGGQPRNGKIRALSWCVVKWVGMLDRVGLAPRIISLENVAQILKWGPLVAKRDHATGRVVTLDKVLDERTGKMVNRVADPGEYVPRSRQFLVPDKRHEGRTWRQFVAALRGYGYAVEWGQLTASDYGAGTSRKRLFLIARRDGEPIVWPKPTHGAAPLLPVVTAADCIDWSIPCRSIFGRKKPLAEATHRRIARGIQRYVIDVPVPFIVPNNANNVPRPVSEPVPTVTTGPRNLLTTPMIVPATHQGDDRIHAATSPLPTITTAQRGEFMAVAPVLVQAAHGEGEGQTARRGSGAHAVDAPVGTIHAGGGSFALAAATLVQTGYGERPGQEPRVPGLKKPLGTLVDGVKHAAVTAYLEQASTGGMLGRAADDPISTIMGSGSQQRIVAAHLATLRGSERGSDPVDEPLRTVSANGTHHAVVEYTLSPEHEAGALRVAAFLINYYGNGMPLNIAEPMDTITTRDRLALVTVTIKGTPYVIVDIGLRMLTRRELFKAQGFPADYIIDCTADGRPLTNDKSVRMVGNSVSPPPLCALIRAQIESTAEPERMAA